MRLLLDIVQPHFVPGKGADMGYPVPHLPSANHADLFDLHFLFVPKW